MWHDSCICVTWLISKRDMIYSYTWHESFIRVTRLFLCVTWCIHVCDMTRLYAWLIDTSQYDITHWYASRDSSIRATLTHSCFWPAHSCVCVLLCFIKPIFGDRYNPGVSSWQQNSNNNLRVVRSSPSTLFKSLAIPSVTRPIVSHCSTLQNTATHCNTLQLDATEMIHIVIRAYKFMCYIYCATLSPHCNTLQHTAKYVSVQHNKQTLMTTRLLGAWLMIVNVKNKWTCLQIRTYAKCKKNPFKDFVRSG